MNNPKPYFQTLGTSTSKPDASIQILKETESLKDAAKHFTINPSGNQPTGYGYWSIDKAYPTGCSAYGERKCA